MKREKRERERERLYRCMLRLLGFVKVFLFYDIVCVAYICLEKEGTYLLFFLQVARVNTIHHYTLLLLQYSS